MVDLLRDLRFGRLEDLLVRGGEPCWEPGPRVIETRKIGTPDDTRPETTPEDFALKRSVVELLQVIADLGEGKILAVEVRFGLPCLIQIEWTANH